MTENKVSYIKEFTKGIIKENPNLIGLLGMCPTLAITTLAINGLGMGAATTFVLVCSNLIICLLRNFIPKEVRLPCYIVIIAGFTTIVGALLERFIPTLYTALGLFLSLITVNCIILGRAEAFASKNTPIRTILDCLGMGVGFTLSLTVIGAIREVIGIGSIFGIDINGNMQAMTIFIMPAGGFFTLGIVIALVNKLAKKKAPKQISCENCPSKDICQGKEVGDCE